jgi:hypothetical protein
MEGLDHGRSQQQATRQLWERSRFRDAHGYRGLAGAVAVIQGSVTLIEVSGGQNVPR